MFKLARSHNWLIFAIINPILEKRLSRYAYGTLLDIGCGEKPYKEMASRYVQEHIGVDHEDTFHDKSNIDLSGTAYEIPVEDNSVDCVLCTYVLEHLEEPSRAIAEAFRVLKPGCNAIYTVPLFWHLHESPRDFYRFTKYGLQYLFKKNGFEVIEITAVSGFIANYCQELVYFIYRYRRGGKYSPLWWIIPFFGHLIQGFAYFMNKIDHSEDFTSEYIVVVRKPPKL